MLNCDAKQARAFAIKVQADDFSIAKVRLAVEPFDEIAATGNIGERYD